jgi:hypothetical protein
LEAYVGDLVVLALGDRYAPEEFVARVVTKGTLLSLAAGSGVAGALAAKHDFMEEPTALRPLARLSGQSVERCHRAKCRTTTPVLCVAGAQSGRKRHLQVRGAVRRSTAHEVTSVDGGAAHLFPARIRGVLRA